MKHGITKVKQKDSDITNNSRSFGIPYTQMRFHHIGQGIMYVLLRITSIWVTKRHNVIVLICILVLAVRHDDVIKWKHFPRYWPFVRGIHRSPVISPHKGQWREALMFSLICTRINGWVNNGEAGDLRRHRAHYLIMTSLYWSGIVFQYTR